MRRSVLLFAGILACAQAGAERCEGPSDLTPAAAQGDADAQAALGYWFAEEGHTDCAVDAIKSSLRQNPESFDTRYNLGVALVESGDYEGAAESASLAAELPDSGLSAAGPCPLGGWRAPNT